MRLKHRPSISFHEQCMECCVHAAVVVPEQQSAASTVAAATARTAAAAHASRAASAATSRTTATTTTTTQTTTLSPQPFCFKRLTEPVRCVRARARVCCPTPDAQCRRTQAAAQRAAVERACRGTRQDAGKDDLTSMPMLSREIMETCAGFLRLPLALTSNCLYLHPSTGTPGSLLLPRMGRVRCGDAHALSVSSPALWQTHAIGHHLGVLSSV